MTRSFEYGRVLGLWPPLNVSTPEEWFCTHIPLPGYDAGKHWTDDHDKFHYKKVSENAADDDLLELSVIKECTKNPTTTWLFGVLRGNQLVLTEDLPDLQPNAMAESLKQLEETEIIAYFLRADSNASWAKGPYGVMGPDTINSLLRIVQGICSPNAFNSQTGWPAEVKKDLEIAYHGFMARLVETSSQLRDSVIFYLPSELARLAEDNCSVPPDKDVIQQMESIVTHWTKQTREILNKHDTTLHFETLGLIEEIDFWHCRILDLGRITEQLQRQDVNCIINTLTKKESNHVETFLMVSRSVQEGYLEANNNFQFLQNLLEPCQRLLVSSPSEIPNLLPEILQLVRIICNLSQFYNTKECISNLLRKISALIIERCRASISLDTILNGRINDSKQMLRASCKCAMSWKEAYHYEASLIKAAAQDSKSETAHCWDFDEASIFVQIDAFVQRCGCLLELCEGQEQFLRKNNVTGCVPGPLPKLGSTKGPGAIKALLGLQLSFEAQINNVRGLKYDIFDVTIHTWHEDYNLLKGCLKNFEVMYINVINMVFEGVTEVSEAVGLLNVFCGLACCQSIKQTCIKKTTEVYQLFVRHISVLRQQFDDNRRNPPLRFGEPQFAGSVLWAQSVAAMATELWDIIRHSKDLVQQMARNESELALVVSAAREAEATYQSFINVTMSYRHARHSLWIEHLSFLGSGSPWLSDCLNVPLLHWDTSKKKRDLPYIACNFNEKLLILFAEVSYWERCQENFAVPIVAHDICTKHINLRVEREHILLIVFEYNLLADDISPSEIRLLHSHMSLLDKQVKQGMSKFAWTSKGVIERYAQDCCAYIKKVHSLVRTMHAYERELFQRCRALNRFPSVKVERKSLQDDKAFVTHQKEYCASVKNTIMRHHAIIVEEMKGIFDTIHHGISGGGVANREWHNFVSKIDVNLKQALSSAVKKALHELGNAINGDAMTEPRVLFGMDVVLSLDHVIKCCPNITDLSNAVNAVAKEIIAIVKAVPYIQESLIRSCGDWDTGKEGQSQSHSVESVTAEESSNNNTPQQQSLYSVIKNDEKILKNATQVMHGMKGTVTEVLKYLKYWDKYKYIWKEDKDALMKGFAETNCKLPEFRAEALQYKELQENVQNEAGIHVIHSIKIDCTSIKSDIAFHCTQWQEKLMGLLNSNASHHLHNIDSCFADTISNLKYQPKNGAELITSWSLLKKARNEWPKFQDQIKGIEDSYKLLKEFDFTISEDEQNLVSGLRHKEDQMFLLLDETELLLTDLKVNMRRASEGSFRTFTESVLEECRWVTEHLPFSGDHKTVDEANAIVSECDDRLNAVQQTYMDMRREFLVLDLEIPDMLEVKKLQQDVDFLKQIWDVVADWDTAWERWKTTSLKNLDVVDMEISAVQFNKLILKLGKDEMDHHWNVLETLSDKVCLLQRILPVIQDLKNPAMRLRHWESLKNEVCMHFFDPTSPEFKIESILSLNLHTHHAAFIKELSSNCNEEFCIETSLADIESRWERFDLNNMDKLDMAEHFQALNDDMEQLNNIKIMKLATAVHFQKDVTHCDETLTAIRQVMDSLVTTQSNCIDHDDISTRAEATIYTN